jgi:hypothetical protein
MTIEWSKLTDDDLSYCVRGLPKKVRDLMNRHEGRAVLAGGYVRAMIRGEDVSDIDIFSTSKEQAERFASNFGGETILTQNATTVLARPYPVQFIHKWTFETPQAVVASFDFTIAQAAVWWDGREWSSACHPSFYADLAARRLNYSRSSEPGGSVLRLLKLSRRGYRASPETVAALLDAVFEQAKGRDRPMLEALTAILREVDPLPEAR